MERHVTGSGQELDVHKRIDCRGPWCVVHAPMQGPWDLWPTYWRSDRRIMERICPHGTGHPVAEDYGRLPDHELVHGCCGCPCSPNVIDGEIVESTKELPWRHD